MVGRAGNVRVLKMTPTDQNGASRWGAEVDMSDVSLDVTADQHNLGHDRRHFGSSSEWTRSGHDREGVDAIGMEGWERAREKDWEGGRERDRHNHRSPGAYVAGMPRKDAGLNRAVSRTSVPR